MCGGAASLPAASAATYLPCFISLPAARNSGWYFWTPPMPASSLHPPLVRGLPRCQSPAVDPQSHHRLSTFAAGALGSPEIRYVQDGAGASMLSPVWTQPPGEQLQPQRPTGVAAPGLCWDPRLTQTAQGCPRLRGSCRASAIGTVNIPSISFPRFTLKNSFFFFPPSCKLLLILHF